MLFFAAAAYFWQLGDKWAAQKKASSPPPSPEALRRASGSEETDEVNKAGTLGANVRLVFIIFDFSFCRSVSVSFHTREIVRVGVGHLRSHPNLNFLKDG